MIIDTQIEHENTSSLRSKSDNRNPFNKGVRSDADDDAKSSYSQASSFFNYDNMRSNLMRTNRESSKSSDRSLLFPPARKASRGNSQTQSSCRLPPSILTHSQKVVPTAIPTLRNLKNSYESAKISKKSS